MHYSFCCWLVLLVLNELFIQTASIICQFVIHFCISDIWIFLCFCGCCQPTIYYAIINFIPDLLLYCSYWYSAILGSPWSDLGNGNTDVSVHLVCHDHFLHFWWCCSLCFELLLHTFFVLTSQLLNTKECSKQGTTYDIKV